MVQGFFVLLAAFAWPIVKRVLIALGIGFVSYQGLSLIGTQINNEIISLWGGISSDMLKMASILGMPQSLGILLGGLAGRIALAAIDRIQKVVS